MDGASWHTYQMPFADIPENAETLLIESSASRPQLHALLIYGHIIANARRMKPVFVAEGEARRLLEKIAPKYLGSYKILPPARLGRFNRIYLFMRAFLWWVQIILGRDLLRLHWHGQQIGDIVYDQYLAARQYARLHRWDRQLVRFIYITLRGINEGEATLRTTRAAAVLLAHRVGLPAAAMANAAQKFGLAIFSFGGNRYGTLLQAPVRKSYEYRATQEDLEPILALADGTLNVLFERVRHELLDGAFNADAKLAFSRKLFCDREEFAHMLGLPRGKKNIFIMLHAFTDYPHSHFNGMLFNDYYDWFMQTLKHAFNDKSVNWIIKSHPASRFYPVKDIDWQQIKATWGAEHIAFMSEDADFDTRSIGNVGDAVITCIGSAGFELSAMAGLPSITAGDNPYASSGFAIFPPNREAYFQTLRNIGSLERLKGESLRRAKATFIFIHRLSRVSISAIPTLSHAEQHAYLFNDSYFERVAKDLRGHEEDFDKELRKYMCAVKCPDFRALRTSPADYLRTLYDYSSI
jgi:hypothetical protein